MTFFYNLILFAMDYAALWRVKVSKSALAWFFSLFAVVVIGVLIAGMLAEDHFDFFRLAAYCLFLHGQVLLLGSTILFWRTKKSLTFLTGISAAVLAVLTYYIFLIEPFWLEVSYWQITSPKIRRPLRIIVVADLQTDHFGDYERKVLRRTMEEKPDLILLAGDYVQAPGQVHRAISRQINAFLREIHFGAPLGDFAVQGNVDPPGWQEIFTDLNVAAPDARKTFDLGELQLTCLSLYESYSTTLIVANPNPDKFHLVLGHVPNFALGHIEGDLLIAGHTHGGQVCIPLIGPLLIHSRIPLSWASGLTVLPGGARLLVSRGIGMERGNAPRMRFLCRPELMVIDLAPDKNEN
jgi:predicted MPP superfamily phosphohydrolase